MSPLTKCPACGGAEYSLDRPCLDCGHDDGVIPHCVRVLYRFGNTETVWEGWSLEKAQVELREWIGACDTLDCWIEADGKRIDGLITLFGETNTKLEGFQCH